MNTEIAQDGLASVLRTRTHALHTRAERSGVVSDILKSRATRKGYTLLLRNLAPAYEALERALEQHRLTRGVGDMARRELYRGPALESDLILLCGADWKQVLPLLPGALRYAQRVAACAGGGGDELVGHAYVRYLGDLSGGQILKRLLAKSLGLTDHELGFYEFPRVEDIAAYKRGYIQALDRVGAVIDIERAATAAVEAFAFNIEISEAVQHLASEPV